MLDLFLVLGPKVGLDRLFCLVFRQNRHLQQNASIKQTDKTHILKIKMTSQILDPHIETSKTHEYLIS